MKKLGVFLDSNQPFHEDYDNCKWGYPIKNPYYYYSVVGTLFTTLERECNCSIIIKMHPKERYPAGFTQSPYGDRLHFHAPVNDMLTDLLIRGADFVISQDSTAGNIAEQYGVPLLMVTMDEFEGRPEGYYTLARAKRNKTTVVNLNRMWGT